MTESFFPLTALSEVQRAQALERFTIIRPALEDGVSQAQVARASKKAESTIRPAAPGGRRDPADGRGPGPHPDTGRCAEHGATLTSTRGSSTCCVCGRSWDWDRLGLPCTEPAAFRVQDREGKDMLLCAGHAIAAREQMEGATVQPIEPEG